MPFDLSTAQPVASGSFDLSTAKPVAQPTIMQTIAASPLGRFTHDAILQPVAGLAGLLAKIDPTGGMVAPMAARAENTYQRDLAAQRNRPGYADARATADQQAKARGAGTLTDQVIAPVTSALAGMPGLATGDLNASNASADAQTAAQQAYAQQNPVKSTIAQIGGGFLAGPTGAASRVPTYAGDLPTVTSLAHGQLPMGPLPMAPVAAPAVMKPGVAAANQAGYVLPPRMISDTPGVVPDALAAWSGKVKTAQAASAKNQDVTNRLAATALGLPPDTVLTDQVLAGVRKGASGSYGAISAAKPVIDVDPQFVSDIQGLGAKSSAAGQAFPGLLANPEIDNLVDGLSGAAAPAQFPTDAGLQLVRQLRKNANSNFKAFGDPAKLDLAFAQRQAADHLDNLIDRNVSPIDPTLVSQYRASRQLLAKAHDVEAATNTATGNVSARKLATMSNRGAPFTGELATIADTANAFPKALQSEASFGETEPLSVLDVAAATVALPHNPSLLGAVLGRPVARAALLSKTMQGAMTRAAAKPLTVPPLQLPQISPGTSMPYGLFGSAMSLPQSQPAQ